MTEALRTQTFSRRALFLRGAQYSVGGLLAARMMYLSIIDNDRYVTLSESNRVNLTLTPPRRGLIVDRAGMPLADNRVSLRIDLVPDRVGDLDRTLARLTELLGLGPDDIERIRRDVKAGSGFTPVQVADRLDEARFAAVSVHLPELTGVQPHRGFARNYPHGPAVAHLVGFVGAATAEEYKALRDPLLITPGFRIGKDGLEKYFEPVLRGRAGAQKVEVTAAGKVVRELGVRDDVPGKTVQLTIDAGLQDYTARRIGRESGAAVIIDCANGAVRAFASMPAFDPNSFSDGIGRLEYKMLTDDVDQLPLVNKASRGLYPPGSTLKMLAALAALEAGVKATDTVNCPGGYRLGNRFFRCLGTHGRIDMIRAIEKSCNTYFYTMAHRLGYDRMAAVARTLGLGVEYDMAGAAQRYGTVPDSEWKRRKYDQPWTASDSLNAAIGQGYVLANPLQLAVMTARIASGRALYPFITGGGRAAPALPYDTAHLDVVREGMRRVVNGNGTAVRSRLDIDGIEMAGKTGTAQVRGLRAGRGGAGVPYRFRDHGLFVCFAPAVAPRFAAAVVIEHGMGGSRAAAPIAKDIFTYLYEPEVAMERLTALEAGWGGDVLTRSRRQIASIGKRPPPVAPATPPLSGGERGQAARPGAGAPSPAADGAAPASSAVGGAADPSTATGTAR